MKGQGCLGTTSRTTNGLLPCGIVLVVFDTACCLIFWTGPFCFLHRPVRKVFINDRSRRDIRVRDEQIDGEGMVGETELSKSIERAHVAEVIELRLRVLDLVDVPLGERSGIGNSHWIWWKCICQSPDGEGC